MTENPGDPVTLGVQAAALPWKRLLAELAVIVFGVLIALGADSYWDHRQDRRAEHQYLEALAEELQAADSVLTLLIDFDSTFAARRATAIRVLTSSGPPAAADSAWREGLGVGFETASFVTGTIATLIATGDINLLRSRPLKLRIGEMHSLLDVQGTRLRLVEELLLENVGEWVRLQMRGVTSLEAMRGSTEFLGVVAATQVFVMARVELHQEIATPIGELRALVLSELDRYGRTPALP